jgi:hypothetical protein
MVEQWILLKFVKGKYYKDNVYSHCPNQRLLEIIEENLDSLLKKI